MYSKLNFNKNKNEATILELLLFDNFFSFCFGISETGLKKGVLLDYSSRRLLLELPSTFEYFDFISCLLDALHDSPYHMIQKYGSFAPIRRKVICKSLLDGEEYYEEVYNKLLNAEKEVFITGWWVSPELYLKRPADNQNEGRLDRILKKIVKEKGIHIKIILYQESKIALSIDSAYTKNKLEKIDSNIIVLRHPNYILPFSWSHHEKMIIIDQKIGFMGGFLKNKAL